jgi:hypothetical protein
VREQLLREEARSSVRQSILMRKSLEALKSIAQSEEPPSEPEQANEETTEEKGDEPNAS